MATEQEIEALADSLIKAGVATSLSLAKEKAREMLAEKKETKETDILQSDKPINDLLQEAGMSQEELKKEQEPAEEEEEDSVGKDANQP
jgi:hypothetical protein